VAFSTHATTSFGTALMRRHAFRESKAASQFAATAVWSRTTYAPPNASRPSEEQATVTAALGSGLSYTVGIRNGTIAYY
jgi:hypothetical protein